MKLSELERAFEIATELKAVRAQLEDISNAGTRSVHCAILDVEKGQRIEITFSASDVVGILENRRERCIVELNRMGITL